jgi:hypothetical protein
MLQNILKAKGLWGCRKNLQRGCLRAISPLHHMRSELAKALGNGDGMVLKV